MTAGEAVRFWIMYLLTGLMLYVILRGFGGMVMHNIRLIRAKLKSASAAIRASRELRKRLQNKGDPK